jgi:hypothetical protein
MSLYRFVQMSQGKKFFTFVSMRMCIYMMIMDTVSDE